LQRRQEDEKNGVLGHQQGPGLQSVNQEGAQHQGHYRIPRDAQSQKGDELAADTCIVGRFRTRDSLNGSLPEVLWVRVLRVPYPILFPLILLFCLIGAYSINNNISDVLIMVIFGVFGYFMKKVHFEGAPLLLGMVLGLMMEDALRQSLIISGGSFFIFLTRPISAAFNVTAFILLALPAIRWFAGRKTRLAAGLPPEES